MSDVEQWSPSESPAGTGLIWPAAWTSCIYYLDKWDFHQESAPGEKSPSLLQPRRAGMDRSPVTLPTLSPLTGHLAGAICAAGLGVAAAGPRLSWVAILIKNKVNTTFGWSGEPEPRERHPHQGTWKAGDGPGCPSRRTGAGAGHAAVQGLANSTR